MRIFFYPAAVIGLLCSLSVGIAQAQIPPPVDIPIRNIPQQTPLWCWAAVAQQIIEASRGSEQTPPQCALVAMANNALPQVCCAGFGNPQCIRPGSLHQIQALIAHFGGRYSRVVPPANPMVLYRTLASRQPIILQIRTGIISAHVVVLRGMTFVRTPLGIIPMLHINDPLAHFTQPVPFHQLMGIWMRAIVVS